MTAASEWLPWDGSVRTIASGQWYQDSAVRKTNFLNFFVSNHLCLSFFELIQKGVSLFNIVFAMITFYATIKFQ